MLSSFNTYTQTFNYIKISEYDDLLSTQLMTAVGTGTVCGWQAEMRLPVTIIVDSQLQAIFYLQTLYFGRGLRYLER